jgi:Predicted N6-adenine-specific DNA methylase
LSERHAKTYRYQVDPHHRCGSDHHRAGVEQQSIANLSPPDGPPGLIIINPPYGTRIGNKAPLLGLYRTMGNVIRAKFAEWKVGIVTTDKDLAKATGLGLELVEPTVLHGGLRVGLWRT